MRTGSAQGPDTRRSRYGWPSDGLYTPPLIMRRGADAWGFIYQRELCAGVRVHACVILRGPPPWIRWCRANGSDRDVVTATARHQIVRVSSLWFFYDADSLNKGVVYEW